MKQSGKSLPDAVEAFALLGARQITLIEKLVTAIKDLNSVKALMWSRKLNGLESKNTELETEAVELEIYLDSPTRLFPEERRNKIEGDSEKMAEIILGFHGETGELPERRKRIYTLLEYLERRTAEKRNTININRVLLISVIAIIVAVMAIVIR